MVRIVTNIGAKLGRVKNTLFSLIYIWIPMSSKADTLGFNKSWEYVGFMKLWKCPKILPKHSCNCFEFFQNNANTGLQLKDTEVFFTPIGWTWPLLLCFIYKKLEPSLHIQPYTWQASSKYARLGRQGNHILNIWSYPIELVNVGVNC